MSDKAWYQGCSEWRRIQDMPELLKAVLPPIPQELPGIDRQPKKRRETTRSIAKPAIGDNVDLMAVLIYFGIGFIVAFWGGLSVAIAWFGLFAVGTFCAIVFRKLKLDSLLTSLPPDSPRLPGIPVMIFYWFHFLVFFIFLKRLGGWLICLSVIAALILVPIVYVLVKKRSDLFSVVLGITLICLSAHTTAQHQPIFIQSRH